MNKQEKKYYLMANYDRVKSFYNKAIITETESIIKLTSYSTDILQLDKKTNKIKWLCNLKKAFSQTTNRHINEFLKQNNFNKLTKKEILKLAGVK